MQEYIKKILGSSNNTILIIPNNEMKHIIEIVKSLEDSGLLFKGVSETIQNDAKEQRGGFLSMLLGMLGTSLQGNILAGKGINRAGGVIRAGYGNKKGQKNNNKKTRLWKQNAFLMLPHPLTNFEIQNIIKMNLDLMVFILQIIYLNAVPLNATLLR